LQSFNRRFTKQQRVIPCTLIINLNVPSCLTFIPIWLEECMCSSVRSNVCVICFVDCNRSRCHFSTWSCPCISCGDILLNKSNHIIKLLLMFLIYLLLNVFHYVTFYALPLPNF